jgi:hypothetical protein
VYISDNLFCSFRKDKQDNRIKKEKPESSPLHKPYVLDDTQPSTSKATQDVTIIDDDDHSSDDLTLTDVLPVATPNTPMRLNRLITANPVPHGAAKATLIICPLSVLTNWTVC